MTDRRLEEARVRACERPTPDGRGATVQRPDGMWYWRVDGGSMWHGPHGSRLEAETDYAAFRERQRARKARR